MDRRRKLSGRCATAEYSVASMVVIVFEIPWNISGERLAVVGVFGVGALEELDAGTAMGAAFDARSVVTFDDDIAARRKATASVQVGHFTGEGILEDGERCNFRFSADIVPGQWHLGYRPRRTEGVLARYRESGELVVSRLE